MRDKVTVGLLVLTLILGVGYMATHPAPARADDSTPPAWFPPAWQSALAAPLPTVTNSTTPPAIIPQTITLPDTFGNITSYQPKGATQTATNAFFQSLGSNGRTCFSCHQPQDGWAITVTSLKHMYESSAGKDPVFAAVDGADCPADPRVTSTTQSVFFAARQQLFTKANFRIGLGLPTSPEWTVSVLTDPTNCEFTQYGLQGNQLSVYRRPLPAANLAFLDPISPTFGQFFSKSPGGTGFSVMWDAREPDLQHQFIDATATHAQATPAQLANVTLTSAPVSQGVAFQTNIYVAQSYSSFYGSGAADLTGADGSGATGGPLPLAALGVGRPIPTFPFVKPLPSVLAGPIPNTLVAEEFTPFDSWAGLTAGDKVSQFRASIARGQAIFNGTAPGSTFVISGVSGLNDGPAGTITNGHCNSCHNVQNTGNDTAAGTQHTGVGDNSTLALPATSDQPLFAFACPVGSIPFFSNPDGLGHDIFITNDPGTGLITGKCKDLGKMKIPVLRGLASRAPYFHGGNAATLDDLVNFYDRRFAIGFTTQQKQDLVNFLNSL